jgi:glucokinase
MKYIIGADLGGSKIEASLFSGWTAVRRSKRKIRTCKGREAVIETVIGALNDVASGADKRDVLGIGIGVPGAVNQKEGSVLLNLKVAGLKGWRVPLKSIIEGRLGIRTFIENDANVFALAESRLGAGRGFKNMVLLTVGTGLGGGVIIDKELYTGSGCAGEVGHQTIVKGGIKCNCGNSGCLESYVSIRAIENLSKKYFSRKMNPKAVFERAKSGDRKAVRIYKEIGEHLGIGLANIANILDPDVIIISGGISKAGRFILDPARKKMRENVFSSRAGVVLSRLGTDAGMLGAALLVEKRMRGKSKSAARLFFR